MELRDHLFISYASEDAILARWLTLKLTAEGYRVWCDQFNLLGGESYPKDIDRAIKDRTFRVIALLSRHSIEKPNPVKERTLALNIARERKVDFLIPVNIDGLKPTELDWMTSDLTFIPFHRNWADGLAQLLKKLRAIDAPRPLADGWRVASEVFLEQGTTLSRTPETLYTNEFRFQKIPETIHRFVAAKAFEGALADELALRWPFYRVDERTVLAFRPPPATLPGDIRLRQSGGSVWPYCEAIHEIPTRNIVTHLLKRTLICHCIQRGLKPVPDRADVCYFPVGLLAGDKIRFRSYAGKRTRVLVTSTRARTVAKKTYRYHLACAFRVFRDGEGYLAQLRLRLHLTDLSGAAIPGRYVPSRRKHITRGWWNHAWLLRYVAVGSFLADDADAITMGDDEKHPVVLAASPLTVTAPFGIDESEFGPVEVADVLIDEADLEERALPELPLDEPEEERWASQ